MTDRFNALVVVLDRDYRSDDAQAILDAIRMIKGVVAVEGNVLKPDDFIARVRVREEIREKIWDVFFPREKEK